MRRRIQVQLNKGEALHALRRFLVIAHEGKIRRKDEEEQNHQAGCLNLLTNAVVVWNTVYMQAAIEQLRREGILVNDEDVMHLSPARYEHINPYGKYSFDLELHLINYARYGRTDWRIVGFFANSKQTPSLTSTGLFMGSSRSARCCRLPRRRTTCMPHAKPILAYDRPEPSAMRI